MGSRAGRAGAVVVLGATMAAAGIGAAQDPGEGAACTVAALQQKAPADVTIAAAQMVEAGAGARGGATLPRHCRVDGHVAVPGNAVKFRVGLPASWNGKFYFQGVGGLGGTIGALNSGLARGYASASTDTGHDASDPTWGANRAKEIDYGHRGTHVTAVAAKALTAAYYGRAPRARLFQRLLERRPAGADGSAALSGRLRRHHRRRSCDRHADAGRTRARVPAHAGVARELPAERKGGAARRGRRLPPATRRMA